MLAASRTKAEGENNDVSFENKDASVTVVSPDAGPKPGDPNYVKPRRRYRRRKCTDAESYTAPSTSGSQGTSQVTLEQAQSIQAVEALLGLDLANTLRGLGDVEIHIPMEDLNSSPKKKVRKILPLGDAGDEVDIQV